MITIYEYNGGKFVESAVVYEDATVGGVSNLADYLRNGFEDIRSNGYKPEDHWQKIENRLYNNFRNGYYWAE